MELTERLTTSHNALQLRTRRERVYTVIAQYPVEAIFPEGTFYSGEIRSEGLVRIEGEFRGKLTAPVVVIARSAFITAHLETQCLYLEGYFRGIATTAFCYLVRGGVFEGEIRAGSILVEDGASCRGKLTIEKGTNGYVAHPGEALPQDTEETD